MLGLFFLYDFLYTSFSSFKMEYLYDKHYNECLNENAQLLPISRSGRFKPNLKNIRVNKLFENQSICKWNFGEKYLLNQVWS